MLSLWYLLKQRQFLLPVDPEQSYWQPPLNITTVPTCPSLPFSISTILIILDVLWQEDKL